MVVRMTDVDRYIAGQYNFSSVKTDVISETIEGAFKFSCKFCDFIMKGGQMFDKKRTSEIQRTIRSRK